MKAVASGLIKCPPRPPTHRHNQSLSVAFVILSLSANRDVTDREGRHIYLVNDRNTEKKPESWLVSVSTRHEMQPILRSSAFYGSINSVINWFGLMNGQLRNVSLSLHAHTLLPVTSPVSPMYTFSKGSIEILESLNHPLKYLSPLSLISSTISNCHAIGLLCWLWLSRNPSEFNFFIICYIFFYTKMVPVQ